MGGGSVATPLDMYLHLWLSRACPPAWPVMPGGGRRSQGFIEYTICILQWYPENKIFLCRVFRQIHARGREAKLKQARLSFALHAGPARGFKLFVSGRLNGGTEGVKRLDELYRMRKEQMKGRRCRLALVSDLKHSSLTIAFYLSSSENTETMHKFNVNCCPDNYVRRPGLEKWLRVGKRSLRAATVLDK